MLATIVVAGNMIGSGIFLLPATLAAVGSVTSSAGWSATVGALALALLFGRLARRKPMAGGPATYVFDAFGPFAGSQASLWYWASCLIGNVAIATAASGYLAAFFGFDAGPALHRHHHHRAAVAGDRRQPGQSAVRGPGGRAAAGRRPGAAAADRHRGLVRCSTRRNSRASWNVSGMPVYQAVPNSLVLVFWAFTGLESASVAAAVVENPERNVPIATIAGVLIAALIIYSRQHRDHGPGTGQRSRQIHCAVRAGGRARLFGPVAGPLVACCGMLKALGTLAGWVLMTAQVSRAAADHGLLPRVLRAHARRRYAGRGTDRRPDC